MPRRRLILLRHAKSSHKQAGLTDHERPLNGRGRRDAPRVGERLVALGWIPGRIVSSDSCRTRQTVERLGEQLTGGAELEFSARLYLGGVAEVRDAIASADDELRTLMLVGHNPGFAEAAAWLSGEEVEVTTGNAVLLESEDVAHWSDTVGGARRWRLVGVVRPRELETD